MHSPYRNYTSSTASRLNQVPSKLAAESIIRSICIVLLTLGLATADMAGQQAQSLGATGVSEGDGIRITWISPGGAAQRAGLTVGDVILTIDEKPAPKLTQPSEVMAANKAGAGVPVTFRHGERLARATLIAGRTGTPGVKSQPASVRVVKAGAGQQNHQPAGKRSAYRLMLATDIPCLLRIDDSDPKELRADDAVVVNSTAGEHLATCVTSDGKDRWSTVVQIEKPGSKVVVIGLSAIKAARVRDEQAQARAIAAQLEQNRIRAAQQQAAEQRRIAAQQQETKRKQIGDLQSQIADLQGQIEELESGAQENEQRAAELERDCGLIRGPCINQMFVYTNRGVAQDKRQQARELRSQMRDLQAEIARIANE